MNKTDEDADKNEVRCNYCSEWLPGDEAVSPEGDDYVLYFCGVECHALWEAERAAELEQEFAAHSGVKKERPEGGG
ncbi:MAG: DUF3330 domain-containing protein [Gammaproteobacteria bacterium]|nr:DUF3330 domain-containing protein [Gammaproteobacteria bacterium]